MQIISSALTKILMTNSQGFVKTVIIPRATILVAVLLSSRTILSKSLSSSSLISSRCDLMELQQNREG